MLEVHQRLRGSADQVKAPVRVLVQVPLVPEVALILLLNLLAKP